MPLKILRTFTPQHDATLGPGDMLYLPPHIAHDGIALDTCTTYSIGFRAAGATELAHALLDFLRDEVTLPGRYADPDLASGNAPAHIDAATTARFAALLSRLRVTPALFSRFLGQWLSEPKPDVVFEPPMSPHTANVFATRARTRGIRLDRRTQMLYDARQMFINGTTLAWGPYDRAALRTLADERALARTSCARLSTHTLELLYQWYCDGYLDTGN
jgi:50S ribosomal protein L16 3-hydroxylase